MKTPPGWSEVRWHGSLFAVPPVSDHPYESEPVSECCGSPLIDGTLLCSRCRDNTALVEMGETEDERALRLIRRGLAIDLGDDAPEMFHRYE